MIEYQKFINECLQKTNEAANNLGYMIKKYKIPADIARSSILSMNRSANSEVKKISIENLLRSRSDYGFIGFTTSTGSDFSYVYSSSQNRWIACESGSMRAKKLTKWSDVKDDIKYICSRYGYPKDGNAEVLLGDKNLNLSLTTKNNIAINDLKNLVDRESWRDRENFKISDREISYRDYILYKETERGYKQFFSYSCKKNIPNSWNPPLNKYISITLEISEIALENIDSKELEALGRSMKTSIDAINSYYRIWDYLR